MSRLLPPLQGSVVLGHVRRAYLQGSAPFDPSGLSLSKTASCERNCSVLLLHVSYVLHSVPTSDMTWINTVALNEAGEKLLNALEKQRALYPVEYATPVHPHNGTSAIVASHSLIPDALFHAFATFGSLMSPELPLSRQQHEMIATMVSVTNRCVY